MKQKILMMFLLTAIFSMTLVSAFTISTSTPVALSRSVNQTSFTITPTIVTDQAINIVATIPQQISDGTNIVNLNSPQYVYTFNNVTLSGTPLGPLTISTGTIPSTYDIGTFTANVVINSTDSNNSSNKVSTIVPISFTSDFCTNGENGTDLSIIRVDISNNDGDDTEWKPLDSISVKVEVSNDGATKISSTYVELGLIDSSGKNVINNMDNLNDKKIKIGSISDGDSSTKTFTFNVPVDFKDEGYKLVVKAYSTDKGGQKALCTAHSSDLDSNYYNTITGTRETDENRQVIVNSVILSPETAQCGEKVQLSGDVVNIGDTDYEDRIKVSLYNKDLKINELTEINTDLSQGDSSSFTIEFDIPTTAAEKTYNLEMRTYYDYDTDDGTYAITSDKTFTKSIIVAGNCIPVTPVTPTTVDPTITADLDESTPDAIAGKEVVLKATVRNNDVKDTTYAISVTDNTAWSSLVSVEPTTITVPAGQSRDVSITLNIDSTAVGKNELTIKATYGNNQVKSSPFELTITKPSSGFGSIGEILAQNGFIYLIILVNVILIIAIIVVIVKMMRPRRAD